MKTFLKISLLFFFLVEIAYAQPSAPLPAFLTDNLDTYEHHPGLNATLEPMGGNRFLCTYNNPLYGVKVEPFQIEGRKEKGCILWASAFIEFLPYDFVKR